jgi:hypothetical protein
MLQNRIFPILDNLAGCNNPTGACGISFDLWGKCLRSRNLSCAFSTDRDVA